MRSLLLTGAAGRVGRLLAPALAQRYRLRLTDRPGRGLTELSPYGETVEADLLEREVARPLFDDRQVVVHLAGNPSPAARFDELLDPNLLAPLAVVEYAVAAGCERLVLASSVHAVSAYPASAEPIPSDAAPRPASPYGVTKAFAEALAHYVGATTPTSVVALRIGAAAGAPPSEDVADVELHTEDLVAAVLDAAERELTGSAVVNVVSVERRLRLRD